MGRGVVALVDLATLIITETVSSIYQKGVDVLEALGVSTESWKSGDPTRSTLYAVATLQDAKESIATGAIKGGFLDTAEGDWLRVKGESDFNTPKEDATYAECTVRLTNTSLLPYTIDPEDLTFSNSGSGATYRNSTGGTLVAGGTLDVTVIAEVAGSDSSAAIGEIDELVSSLPGVTVTNTTAAVGRDEEEDEPYRERCRAKLAALSPNGPAAAYDYVAKTSNLNGGANVSKTRVDPDSDVGLVTVYLASSSGAVSGGDVTLVQTAFDGLVEPLTIEALAVSATAVTQAVTYTLWVYSSINKTSAEIQALVSDALTAGFGARPIGGDVIPPALTGNLYKGWIEATILKAVEPYGFRVSVTTPSADVALALGEVVVLGTITPTINLIAP